MIEVEALEDVSLGRIVSRMSVADMGYKTPCWISNRCTVEDGYTQISISGRVTSTHRAAWAIVFGPVPVGLVLDHLCRQRNCCNPWHLEPVTNTENVLRGTGFAARNAVKTHCVHGHEFTPENTRHSVNRSERVCRTCKRESDRVRRLRMGAKPRKLKEES